MKLHSSDFFARSLRIRLLLALFIDQNFAHMNMRTFLFGNRTHIHASHTKNNKLHFYGSILSKISLFHLELNAFWCLSLSFFVAVATSFICLLFIWIRENIQKKHE